MKTTLFLLWLVVLASCGQPVNTDATLTADATPPSESSVSGGSMGTAAENYAEVSSSDIQSLGATTEKISYTPKLIKEANLTLKLNSYRETKKKLPLILSSFNAAISHENETGDNYQIRNQLTIRVENARFDSLINALESLALHVDQRIINTQDISEEYIDSEARLKTKKIYEQKFLELLNKTSKMSDIILLQNQLKLLREEIESIEGRLNYLKHQVALCTIHLTLYESLDYTYQPIENGFTYRLQASFAEGWNSIQSIALGIVSLWPLWIIFGFFYFFNPPFL